MRRSTTPQPEAKKPQEFIFDVQKPFYRFGRPINPEDPKVKKDGVKMSKETARFLVANGTLKLRKTKAEQAAEKKPESK